MNELSTHLYRDKRADDHLERILEPWGIWRAIGAEVLFSPRKSPIEGYNSVETAYTDSLDRRKMKVLSLAEYREWITRVKGLNQPKDTAKNLPKVPNYTTHRYYANINRLLSEIHESYYAILVHRYEDGWELNDFMREWGKDLNYASKNMSRARDAARKILRKNGIRV